MTAVHQTGPQHYAQAESDIDSASETSSTEHATFLLARAEVHAKLAQASATAMAGLVGSGQLVSERRVEVADSWKDYL